MWRSSVLLALVACAKQDDDPRRWESVETTTANDQIIIEKVSYRSEGLRIVGQVCRPATTGRHPVLVSNHGGFSGIGANWNGGSCADGARNGYVVVESSYRGEDGSDGHIEACLGEVTDVLAMLDIVAAQPYADPTRMLMWGASHGGCITTRAVQRGAPVNAAVDVFGPTDWAIAYESWRAGIAAGSPWSAIYESLIETLDTATGGPPQSHAEAYRMRSPSAFADDLARSDVPFLVTQGVNDALVPAAQSCDLVTRAGGFASYHLAATGVETQSPPTGCESFALAWLAEPRPRESWPGSRYLVVYDGLGHDFNGAAGQAMLGDVLSFLIAKSP
jgi:dipeptidyl aminopeptidase/acylaminoacyl peptidase